MDDNFRWLYDQQQQHHADRLMWLEEDRATMAEANKKHREATKAIGRYMLYRGIIETFILITLVWSLF